MCIFFSLAYFLCLELIISFYFYLSPNHTLSLCLDITHRHTFFLSFLNVCCFFYAHIVSLSFSKSSIFLLYPFLSLSFFLFLCLSLTFSLFLCLSLSVSRSLTHRFYALWQICIRDAVQVFQLHDKRVSLAYSGGKNSFLYLTSPV